MSRLKVRLTLQENLSDLRDETKLTLTALSEATGIPTATLQRLEANDDHHASYTDVAALATFYDVSADYLFGQTDNRRQLNVEIDALRLSDTAIEVLKDGKLNRRLLRACSVSWFNGFFKQIDVLQGSVDDAYSLRTLGNADAEERKISKKAVKDEILNRLLVNL